MKIRNAQQIPVEVRTKMLNALVDHQFLLSGLSWACVLLTLLFGALSLVGSREANRRQSLQVLSLEKDTADAKTRQADAERRLEEVKRIAEPRQLDEAKFVAALKDKAKGTVKLVYKSDDTEAFGFALQLLTAFQKAGWKGNEPEPLKIPTNEFGGQKYSGDVPLPDVYRAGGMGPLTMWGKGTMPAAVRVPNAQTFTIQYDPTFMAVIEAFEATGLPIAFHFSKDVKEYDVLILVGAKQ